MRSKPDFEIDITRGSIILGFNCSYASNFDNTEELEETNGTCIISLFFISLEKFIFYFLFFTEDVFNIDEVTIYENKFSDNKYALAGDTLDAVSSLI